MESVLDNKVDIKKEVIEFIDRFNVRSCDDLKKLDDYLKLKNETLKSKIYQRVYYLEKKNGFENSNSSFEKFEIKQDFEQKKNFEIKNGTPQNLVYKPYQNKKELLYLAVIIFIFIFLMNESRLFYKTFGFSGFNAFILPVVIELSILMLSRYKSIKGRMLLVGLVLFNTTSFSYYTVYNADKEISKLENFIEERSILKSEKARLLKEYEEVSRDLVFKKKVYKAAVNKKLITRAETLHLPRVQELEGRFKGISQSITELNKRLRSQNKTSGVEIIYIGSASLIILKILLQFVGLFLVNDIRNINVKN